MTTEHDLLESIAATPDEDGPRLVFADWVEEHGDPERAEFIRLQIRLAAMDEYDSDFKQLSERESELLSGNFFRWKIPDLKGRQEFHRGFVDFVWMRGDRLKIEANRVNDEPTVTALRVSGVDSHLDSLAALPYLHRIRKLDLSNNTLPAGNRLLRFFESFKTPNLCELALRNNVLWPEQLDELSKCESFQSLRALDVSGNPLSDEGATILSIRSAFRNLHRLIYRSNRMDIANRVHEPGAIALAESDQLHQLAHLNLSGHAISSIGMGRILTSPSLEQLEWLDLSDNRFEDSDHVIVSVFDNKAVRLLPSLRVLVLRHYHFEPQALKVLRQWQSQYPNRILDLS